jgi:hypothetical protein
MARKDLFSKVKDEVAEVATEPEATEVVAETEEVKKEAVSYVLDNGEPTSRAGYIRQEFMKDKSRKEIAEELKVSYNIVFSATANMFNKAHPEGASGRGQAIMAEDPDTGETKPRREIMRSLFEKGWTRAEIAAHFKCPYGTVYGATKDLSSPDGKGGGKVYIDDPDNPGEQIARVDFIRAKWAEGMKRRDIANAAGCDYSVVWMATKPEKGEEDTEGDEASDEDRAPIEYKE